MLKKVLATAVLVLAATFTQAQGAAKDGTLALLYNVSSATLTYCSLSPGPFASPVPVAALIKTSGSSTTVVEVVSGAKPFTGIVVGDVLIIQTPTATNPSATTIVAVTAHASDSSITVDTAITLAGNNFGFYHHVCGTTVNDGWVAVGAGTKSFELSVQYDQGDLDALSVRWECRHPGAGALPVILFPGPGASCGIGGTLATDHCEFATAGINSRLSVRDDSTTFAECRVGLAFKSTDTADTTTNLEKVTVKVSAR